MYKYALSIFIFVLLPWGESYAKQHGHIVEVHSKQQFEQLLTHHSCVVADFYAPWCGPCKRMNPIVHEISSEYPDVCFLKINIDAVPSLAHHYHVTSVPTFMFFKNNKSVCRRTGTLSKRELKNILTTYL